MEEVSLVELRRGSFVRRIRESISIVERELVVRGLSPGFYDLLLKPIGRSLKIRVFDGSVDDGLVRGRHHIAELSPVVIPHIRSMTHRDDGLLIDVRNHRKTTRVHVWATHHEPMF